MGRRRVRRRELVATNRLLGIGQETQVVIMSARDTNFILVGNLNTEARSVINA